MQRVLTYSLLGTALLLSLGSTPVRANPDLFERTLRSTAWVISPGAEDTSLGTGVLLDVKGKLVLTNYHAVTAEGEILRSVEGRYTLASRRLVLSSDGKTLLQARLRWISNNELVLTASGSESRWARLRK